MNFTKYALVLVFTALFCWNIKAEHPTDLKILNHKSVAWANVSKVKSRKAGHKPAKGENPAEMWFKPTPGTNERYIVALKPFSVNDYDYLVLKYKISPDTYLTMDVWWDKGKQKRPLRYVPGDREAKILRLPVAGKTVRIVLQISSKAKSKSESIRKVSFDSFKGLKEKADLKVKIYRIHEPILIPEPKKYKLTGKKLILAEKQKIKFTVRLNKEELALKKIIAKEIADDFKISEEFILNKSSSKKTIINLEFGKECRLQVPNKQEAYALKFSQVDNSNIITLAAKDKAGLYWAWQTLRQLIEKNDNSVKVNICDITDWPDYQHRGINAYNIEKEKLNLAYKFNYTYLPWWVARKHMHKLNKEYISNLKAMCDYAVSRGTSVTQWLSPFFDKGSITVSDDKQIDKLFKVYEISLKTGNRTCLLGIDDGGRHKNSFTPADQKAYNNDRLLSHAYFIKKLSDKIYAKYPDAELIACTKNYETAKGITGYYDRIGISKNVIITWTGEQCVTFDYPEHIIKKYEKGIEGRKFNIYDNTPGQTHGMYRRLSICEKYAGGYGYLYNSKQCIGVSLQYSISNQVREILVGSAAEYLWNASRYDAEKARQRAIAKIAGNIEAVKPILLFSQEYLKIAYKYPIDKRIRPKKDFYIGKGISSVVGYKELKKREIAKYSIDNDEYKKLCERILFLGNILEQIEKTSRNKLLTDEFKLFYSNMKEIIDYLYKNNVPAPLIEAKGIYCFNMNNVAGGTLYKKRGPAKLMSAAIYGNQTANNTFTAAFNLKSLPAKNVILELDGWDCDKNLPPMLIEINKQRVFSGKTTFGHTYPYKTGPGNMTISVPAKCFTKGKNIIKIIDNAPASDFIDNWIIIAGIKLKFQ